MRLRVKFQSISDIITNSSSEIFTIVDERPLRELKKIILELGENNFDNGSDSSSGMGGDLEVKNWEDYYNEWLSWIPESKRHQATPEIWALQYEESLEELKKLIWIDIDWNRKATIDWILKSLWVIDVDGGGCFEKDPETGRILRSITYEEAKKLPKERIEISWD